jgi:hypothetical protein
MKIHGISYIPFTFAISIDKENSHGKIAKQQKFDSGKT